MIGVSRCAPSVTAIEDSTETAVGAPQRAGTAGGVDDEGRQFGPVGHGERDVCAAAAATRSAVGPRREVPVREEPDIEGGEGELLTASGLCPAEGLWDRDVDRQSAHVETDVAAHARIVSRELTSARAAIRYVRCADEQCNGDQVGRCALSQAVARRADARDSHASWTTSASSSRVSSPIRLARSNTD